MERVEERWASCGAMALTGDADGEPLAPPSRAPCVLDELLAPWELGAEILAARAALLGLRRGGQRSAGGATRLLRCADGWVAVSLARADDVELLPAWLGLEPRSDTPVATGAAEVAASEEVWADVAEEVARHGATHLVSSAAALGLPCSTPGERSDAVPLPGPLGERPDLRGTTVVDLSALWAGPLCADLLGRAGATVVKVEDPARPDGARRHPPLYDLLNAHKLSVALDLRSGSGRDELRRLLRDADVIVTSARRRAFEQLDLVPDAVLGGSARPAPTWVALTAHGWTSERVGFGDDAAVAGGLLAWHPADGAPRFAADAVADPLTGALAALDAVHALRGRTPSFVDRSLAGTAASLAASGPASIPAPGTEVAPPRAPGPTGSARELGADTASVLAAVRAGGLPRPRDSV